MTEDLEQYFAKGELIPAVVQRPVPASADAGLYE